VPATASAVATILFLAGGDDLGGFDDGRAKAGDPRTRTSREAT
jgi:hypothetical protein